MNSPQLSTSNVIGALVIGYALSLAGTYKPLYQSVGNITSEKLGTLTVLRYMTIFSLNNSGLTFGEEELECGYREGKMGDLGPQIAIICRKVQDGMIQSMMLIRGDSNTLSNFEVQRISYKGGSFRYSGSASIVHEGKRYKEND